MVFPRIPRAWANQRINYCSSIHHGTGLPLQFLILEAELNRAWGSVDGDGNADAIIASQREARRGLAYVGLWHFALVAGFALWYSLTASAVALALELIAVAWLTIGGVRLQLHQMNTMVLVAEARIRLLENR